MKLIFQTYIDDTGQRGMLLDADTGQHIGDIHDPQDARTIVEAFRLLRLIAEWPDNGTYLLSLQQKARILLGYCDLPSQYVESYRRR